MYKSPSLNPLSIESITNNNNAPIDQTRRKRLKVLSACNECRRKKTKCNGEKPCTGCLKANVECKYSNNNVKKAPQQQTSRPVVAPITPRSVAPPPPPPQPQPQPISHSQTDSMVNMNKTLWNTVQSIEGRLSTIENILQILLQQQQQQRAVNDHPTAEQYRHGNQQPSRPVVEDRRPSDDRYYRRTSVKDYPRRESYNYERRTSADDYPGQKKRRFEETQMKLPSPSMGHYHSDTSSTTSSVCSSLASPKITAISSLLNNEKPSIHKPTILQNHYYY